MRTGRFLFSLLAFSALGNSMALAAGLANSSFECGTHSWSGQTVGWFNVYTTDEWWVTGSRSVFFSTMADRIHYPSYYTEVCQTVDLTDVDSVFFDVHLEGGTYTHAFVTLGGGLSSSKLWTRSEAGSLYGAWIDVQFESGLQKLCLGIEVFGQFSGMEDCRTYFDNIQLSPGPVTPGDFDYDTDVDLQDFAEFQNCFAVVAHNCCDDDHGPGCTDPEIEECVCFYDDYCCDADWDYTCVGYVTSQNCGTCGAGVHGDCVVVDVDGDDDVDLEDFANLKALFTGDCGP